MAAACASCASDNSAADAATSESEQAEFAGAKRRRMRWGAGQEASSAASSAVPSSAMPSADELALRIEDVNRLLRLPGAAGPERAGLLRQRVELVRQFCAVAYAGREEGSGQIMSLKLIIPAHPSGGGPLPLVGLIIGPRGNTQKRMQAETGTTITVRGRGTRRVSDSTRDESDDEPPHVLVRAPPLTPSPRTS